MSNKVNLINGSVVPYGCVAATCNALERLANTSPQALRDLIKMCYRQCYVGGVGLSQSVPSTLQSCTLISRQKFYTNEGRWVVATWIPQDVRKVILCSTNVFADPQIWLQIQNPINGTLVMQIPYPGNLSSV